MSSFFDAVAQHDWTPPKQKHIRLYYDENGTLLDPPTKYVDVDFVEDLCYIVISQEQLDGLQPTHMKVIDKKLVLQAPKRRLWFLRDKIDEYNPYFIQGEKK
jgi:hypothetical protein